MSEVNENDALESVQSRTLIDPAILEALNSDHFHPPVTLESSNFILPEDQLEVHIIPRERTPKIVKYALRTGPLYLTTCYEEFSRKLISVHISSESSTNIDLEKQITDNDDANAPQNLMKYYNPGYDYWKSTFKRHPSDAKLFNGEDSSLSFNLLLKLHKCNVKQKCFEPIFGIGCFYTFFNDELIRITESFYFDATPEQIRLQFKKVYQREGQDSNHHTFYGNSINIGDATQINPHLNMFLVNFPKDLKFQEVFLIIQLNKVLTNEPDKAVLPYCKGGTNAEQQKLKENTDRLNKFRQPLAFGIVKVLDNHGQLGGSIGGGNFSFPFYAQKLCFTDVAFGQAIKEMFPTDGSAPYFRFEQLEIDMHMTVYDLGTSDQILDRIRELGIIPDGEKAHIIESEIPSDMSQLVFAPESSRLDHLGKKSGSLSVRKLVTLIPNTIAWMKSLSRQIKTRVENSLYLYVLQFDKFPSNSRNLSVKIELVEFKGQLTEQRLPTENIAHDVIPSIYNYTTLLGPQLVKEAYSRISYHNKNSPANDEFKIRLPDVLTSRHWIKISVYHVHVKTHNRGSLMNSLLRANNDKDTADSNCVGVGFLPLHTAGGALIPDLEHVVPVYPPVGSEQLQQQAMEIPIIRLRSRALCSLVSSDKQIQSLIRNIPLPLGYLPSSIMPEAIAAQLIVKAASIRPKEETLEANLEELPRANALELSQHFLVITRALNRALLAGTCVYDEAYANPFKHCKARCRAFLTLLKILDKIIQVVGSGFEDEKERAILEAYVDFVLDEEVPLENLGPIGNGVERLSMYVDTNLQLDGSGVTKGELTKSHSFGADEFITLKKTGSASNVLNRSRKNSLEAADSTIPPSTLPPPPPSVQEERGVVCNDGDSGSSDGEDDSPPAMTSSNKTGSSVERELNKETSAALPSPTLPQPPISTSPRLRLATADSPGVVVTGATEISELDSEGFSKRTSRRLSDEESIASNRRSWGKYLTESHWSTGKFVPINEINDEGHNVAEVQSNAYLEAISNHIANQAVRIIEETLIGVAVYAMGSIIRANTERDDTNDDGNLLTESSILEIKPSRYSTKIGSDSQAYPFRKYPLSLDGRSSADYRAAKNDLLIDDPLVEELVSKSSWVHPLLDSAHLPIPVAAPLYDSLAGYRERAVTIDDPSNALGKHWWPWLYEVLTFQWGAVLALILSSLQLISSSNLESIVGSYQFDYELSQISDKRDWRTILMEEGPLLLRMIYKSLAMRIQREGKRAPVLLDEQYFNALENLVMLIAVEASTTVVGLWRSKKIILSLSHFLRSLFALVAPNQVLRLLRSFFKTIRKSRGKNEEVDLRLLMIEELSLFDYFIALNLPYSLDAPVHCFSFTCIDPSIVSVVSMNPYTSVGLRYETSQTPYALVHLLINEIIFSCRQDYRKSEKAWEILRDLVVRHSYDQRYQSKDAQQRIICMYLPLIHEITSEVNHLAALRYNSAERREALSILLYVLGGTPVRLLRSRIRTISSQIYMSNGTGVTFPENGAATTRPSIFNESDKFIAQTKLGNSFISDFLRLMHLLIDTFEIPYNLSNSTISSKDEAFLKLLSPSVQLDSSARAELNHKSVSGRKVTVSETLTAPPQRQSLLANLTNLDQRMQSRKTTSVTSRKSNSGALKEGERGWIEHARKVATIATEKERSVIIKPISRDDALFCAEKFSASATKIMLSVLWIIIEECPKIIIEQQQSQPTQMEDDVSGTSKPASPLLNSTPLRQQCIEESIICSNEEKELAAFLRQALCVPLHALYCNQVDSALAEIYSFISSIVKRFGAKMFLVSLEDSLQYWLRITLIHFASDSLLVRHTACNFFLTLLDMTFQHFGSFAAISTTVLAILNDVLNEILEANRPTISTYSDEDRALQGFIDAFREIRETAEKNLQNGRKAGNKASSPRKSRQVSSGAKKGVFFFNHHRIHPMAVSLIEFVKSVEVVFRANADVRRYLSLPAGYDFFGANLLDGPYDDRTSLLLQILRQNRRNVKNDANYPNDNSNKSSAGNFQLEEVMMHFVAAAEVYDVFKLPRFKMQWLENLARLHQSKSNRAEGAEVRWRIFKICQQIEDRWPRLWSPRPPLQWQRRGKLALDSSASGNVSSSPNNGTSDADGNRDFYRVLTTALDSRPLRPWLDINQFWTHKITALTVSRQLYSSVCLISLAERGSTQLIQLYRLAQHTPAMIEEYDVLAGYWKAALEKGITNSMALGTFYRVFYTGLGAPAHLREKEFIFRNANHLHVSEFHSLVTSHLKSIVAEGVEVKIIHDITAAQDHLRESNAALIVMNSVKPIRRNANSVNSYKLINSSIPSPSPLDRSSGSHNNTDLVDEYNQLTTFQYSVPFTQDGGKAHAKKMDDQWMKYTTLTVKESFPYILTRQLVAKREVTILSPIEVAIYDIEERIESMEKELEFTPKTQSDNNNMMRIVQGTVLPQVNAGATEVAKVFLNTDKIQQDLSEIQKKMFGITSNEIKCKEQRYQVILSQLQDDYQRYLQLVNQLKTTLINFLQYSKLLLLKCRNVLVADQSILVDKDKSKVLEYRGGGGGYEMNDLIPLTYPSIVMNTNPLQSMNLSFLASGSLLSGVGSGISGGISGPNSLGSGLTSGREGRGSVTSGNLGAGLGGITPPISTPLASLWKTADSNVSSNGSGVNNAGGNANGGNAAANNQPVALTAQEINNIKWQMEMEKGFDTLVQTIYPYIADIKEADVFNVAKY